MPKTVAMTKRARESAREDLHVAVRMHAKACASSDVILVEDPKAAEMHVARIVVIGEGEGVARVQPAVVGVAAFIGLAEGDHGVARGFPLDAEICFNAARKPTQSW